MLLQPMIQRPVRTKLGHQEAVRWVCVRAVEFDNVFVAQRFQARLREEGIDNVNINDKSIGFMHQGVAQ